MAATEKLNIPNEVIKENWKDDIDVGYATYGNEKQEMEYISPDKVSKEGEKKIKEIKRRNIKLGHFAVFARNDKLLS